jgi:uncharacterized protein
MQYLIVLPIGVLVGLLLGVLGGGGAILAVPALVYLLGQQPRAATFASLVIVVVSASAGLIGHWRAGRVRVGAGVTFAAAGLAGSFVGSRVSVAANPNTLLLGFAILMLFVAAMMAWRQLRAARPGPTAATGAAGADRAHSGTPHRIRQVAVIAATATGIGFLTGLFGVGGGIVVVPTLVLALGFAMPIAVGTSLVVIVLNSLAAIAARLGSHISLDWPLIAVFTSAAVIGAVAGNRIAGRINTRRLTQGFIVLLMTVAAYTASRSLLQLA